MEQTPKEKAIELVERFENLLNPDRKTYKCTECIECALVVYEEVMDELIPHTDDMRFWIEVKKELEKLKP